MIDSKFFAGDCLVAAIGVDLQGKKHVLGLWHGATENATVVKGLLEDLVSRGLESERKMLIVLDGAKALRKAVQMVLGQQAVVQRCRIHKLRNVLDQLPEEKKAQAGWRLRAAWAKKDPKAADRTHQVKRWDGPRMILRWTAAALLSAEKNFRRIKGCEQLNDLEKVLHELETTSTLKAA